MILLGNCNFWGHSYEAVHDEIPNPLVSRISIEQAPGDADLKKLFTLKKYVKHVCKKCGDTIGRDE